MISTLSYVNRDSCCLSLEITSNKVVNLLMTFLMVKKDNIPKHLHFRREVFQKHVFLGE